MIKYYIFSKRYKKSFKLKFQRLQLQINKCKDFARKEILKRYKILPDRVSIMKKVLKEEKGANFTDYKPEKNNSLLREKRRTIDKIPTSSIKKNNSFVNKNFSKTINKSRSLIKKLKDPILKSVDPSYIIERKKRTCIPKSKLKTSDASAFLFKRIACMSRKSSKERYKIPNGDLSYDLYDNLSYGKINLNNSTSRNAKNKILKLRHKSTDHKKKQNEDFLSIMEGSKVSFKNFRLSKKTTLGSTTPSSIKKPSTNKKLYECNKKRRSSMNNRKPKLHTSLIRKKSLNQTNINNLNDLRLNKTRDYTRLMDTEEISIFYNSK